MDERRNGAVAAPARQLKTDRSLLKFILLSIITICIYGIVAMTSLTNDINTIISRYDGKKTMHFCLLFFIFIPITASIAAFVWFHRISARIGMELQRRGITECSLSPSDYWLWGVLGALIVVGPFVDYHKLF